MDVEAGVIGEGASTLRIQDYVNRCEDYRLLFEQAFDKLGKITNTTEMSLLFGDVIEKSMVEKLDLFAKETKQGLNSRKRQIMEYWNCDESEAVKIMEEIDSEKEATLKRFPPAPTATSF